MRIAIVNDLPFAVAGLQRILLRMEGVQIAWIAKDGKEAVDLCEEDPPDLILMDLVMPVMNGAESTREIMKQTPCPILLVTADIEKNNSLVFEGLGYGALDVVQTPPVEGSECAAFVKKIRIIEGVTKNLPRGKRQRSAPVLSPLIPMGASSGGPSVIQYILSHLSHDFHSTLVIVQHIDEQFSPLFVSWLSKTSKIPVSLAEDGKMPLPGRAYVAAADNHLLMTKEGKFRYTPTPENSSYTPSIDVFFESVSKAIEKPGLAVLLTGMGNDGMRGMQALYEKGWYTLAQDASTSAVYGMPKAALDRGVVSEMASQQQILSAIKRMGDAKKW